MKLTVQEIKTCLQHIIASPSPKSGQIAIFDSPSAHVVLTVQSLPNSESLTYKSIIYAKKTNDAYYAYYRFQVYPEKQITYDYRDKDELQYRPPVGLPKSVREAVRDASTAIAYIYNFNKGDKLH